MGLDVSLYSKTTISKKGTGVFIRENGNNKELTISLQTSQLSIKNLN